MGLGRLLSGYKFVVQAWKPALGLQQVRRTPSIMITSALPALEGRQGDVWVCLFTRVAYQRASTAVRKPVLKKKKNKNPGKQRRYMPLASVCICGHTQIIKQHILLDTSERFKSFFSIEFLNVSYGMLKPSTEGSPRAAGKASCKQSHVLLSPRRLPAGPV